MDKQRVLGLLGQASRQMGVTLRPCQLELFWLYLQELLEWNRKVSLTAIRKPEQIIIKHFVDSITPLPYLAAAGELLDLGSGAGFPGLPLKIAAPRLHLHLVEASQKKASFLKHVIRTLGLREVQVWANRIEQLPWAELSRPVVISRAFKRPEKLLELTSALLERGSILVAMLGPTTVSEQARLRALARAREMELTRAVSLFLPRAYGGRTLLFFQKH